MSEIIWFEKYMPELYRKTWKFLNIVGCIVLKFVGKPVINADEVHVTWLADVRKPRIEWSLALLKNLGITEDKLPIIKMPWEIVGDIKRNVAHELGLPINVKVVAGSGDIAATGIGSGAVEDYETHLYLGTSDWLALYLLYKRLDIFHAIGTLISAIPGKYLLIAEQESGCSVLDYIITLLGSEINKRTHDIVDKNVLSIDMSSNKIS